MAGNIQNKYGSNAQSITITSAATLASAGAASSAAVDNTSNLFQEALVSVKVTTSASALGTAPNVAVYAYGTTDGGTTYGGGESNMGTDHTVTLTVPPNIYPIGVINTPTTSTTYWITARSIAAAFGGALPDHWGIVVVNLTGQALTACTANYEGVYSQYT